MSQSAISSLQSASSVLVTGGAGFIGSHLVDALVEQGHKVRVYDNLEPQVHGALREEGEWPAYCNPQAEYVLGDVRDREGLQEALQGVDVVYHQAAMVGVGQSMYQIERYVDVNTRGTAILLDILANDEAIRERVQKVVVASSMSIYGEGHYRCAEHGARNAGLRPAAQLAAHDWEPRCPICNRSLETLPTPESKRLEATSIYAISKKDQEEMTLSIGRAYEIPVVALRYFNTYGPRQALSNPYTGVAAIFSGRLLNGNAPVIFEDGRQTRDFVHVSDIVQANLLAAAREEMNGQVFNVGTGRASSILEVAELLIEHLDVDVEPEVTNQFRAGDIRHCVADVSRLEGQGYRPRVSLDEGIPQLIDWVRTQKPADSFQKAHEELTARGLAS